MTVFVDMERDPGCEIYMQKSRKLFCIAKRISQQNIISLYLINKQPLSYIFLFFPESFIISTILQLEVCKIMFTHKLLKIVNDRVGHVFLKLKRGNTVKVSYGFWGNVLEYLEFIIITKDLIEKNRLDVVVHNCNLSTQEIGRSIPVSLRSA